MKKLLYLILFIITNASFGQKNLRSISDSIYVIEETKKDDNLNDKDSIVTFSEEEAQFPGGNVAMANYISTNMKYPVEAMKKKVEGRVIVAFVVTKTGELSDIKILKGVDPYVDKEALRLISEMPKWRPAQLNGRSVNQRKSIPIIFALK